MIEEKVENGLYTGFSDNYLRCYVKGDNIVVGEIIDLKVDSIFKDGYLCKL